MLPSEKLTEMDKLLHERTQLTKLFNDWSARGICSPEKKQIQLKIKAIDQAIIQLRMQNNPARIPDLSNSLRTAEA
jgi:hypothetical protein